MYQGNHSGSKTQNYSTLIDNNNIVRTNSTNAFGYLKFYTWKFRVDARFRWVKKVIGIGIILLSLLNTIETEKDAVKSSRYYNEGVGSVQILSNSHELLSANDGKLVYVTGYIEVESPLQSNPYGVSIQAVKLKRRVQMCQWIEVMEISPFQEFSYQYTKVWKDKLINSSNFHHAKDHENPIKFPLESEIQINPSVWLGSFRFGHELKEKFNQFTQFTSGQRPEVSDIKMHMGLYYHAYDIWKPEIGDVRIQFSFAGLADTMVSVIGKQVGNVLEPYETESGNTILYIHEGGIKGHLEMLEMENYPNLSGIWINRGWEIMFIFVGAILIKRRHLISSNSIKTGLVISLFLWFNTIGTIWISYKPIFGSLLLIFTACLMIYHQSSPRIRKSN